jgi:hypothetical protein
MFAWFQLDFSAIPVSISADRETNLAKCKQQEKMQRIRNVQEGKRNQKKRHLDAFVFVPSVCGERFPTAEF